MLSHSGNGCWSQPLVIYIRYTQAKWVVGHVWAGLQDVLVEPSVFLSRDTLSEGGPIPCQVGIQSPISAMRFLILYYICGAWDASVPLDCYLLVFRHYDNIRQDIDFKTVLGYRKVKTVRVYVWIWSYDYPFLSKRFWTLKSWLDDLPLLLCEFISLWFTRLTRCFVNARVSPGCIGSGHQNLRSPELR